MSVRVDPGIVRELGEFGGQTASRCFNCGNCTAVCSLSGDGATFPRRFIRYIQLGLAGRMGESIDPWLCYYCGDCSDTCPRDARPGNLMMASRRWLTSRYDWTGLSRLMYRQPAIEVVALGAYAAELVELVIHGLTQKRWRDCSTDATKHWLRHLFLVTGYGTMFALVVVFLYWFQVQDASFHWTSLLGYYSTLVLLAATLWIMRDRLERKDQIHKHSDLSDWLFVILLFWTSATGILLHLSRLVNLPMPTYVLYVVHLMIAVPMLAVEVPFSKWSHLLYRPLAMYLAAVQARARQRQLAPLTAPAVHA